MPTVQLRELRAGDSLVIHTTGLLVTRPVAQELDAAA